MCGEICGGGGGGGMALVALGEHETVKSKVSFACLFLLFLPFCWR